MTRSLVIEHRALAPRKPAPDPIAELLAAATSLQNVPRDSAVTIPDILFHNRRVAGRIKATVERIERTWEPKGTRRISAPPSPKRDRLREIVAAQGRRVRVLERGRCAAQMELGL